ncbi:hypothetical protein NDU88_003202 [Pleurodeles waltl]|uniref:Uncharacterized protein n=1 Tax=Pleurodeles waltl TaxID=8319 RepID=A0AAV7QE75_PLEWA|nr:hypothetical protein NDU88_003202 [Pleurodeles waltl]
MARADNCKDGEATYCRVGTGSDRPVVGGGGETECPEMRYGGDELGPLDYTAEVGVPLERFVVLGWRPPLHLRGSKRDVKIVVGEQPIAAKTPGR